jgi:O-antigen/teichoic acid export membrane protein
MSAAEPRELIETAHPGAGEAGSPQVRSAPRNKGLGKRLAFGFGAQLLTLFVHTGEHFLMVPLYLYAWDVQVYEDWLLLGAAAGALIRFLDFGLERYYSATLRMSYAAEQWDTFNRQLAAGLGLYLLIVCVSALAVTAFVLLPVRSLFGLTAMSASEAAVVFWCMMASRFVLLPKAAIKPIYAAHGDFSRGENIITLTTALQAMLIAVLLLVGASPSELAVMSAFALLFTNWLPMIWDQRRRYPGVHRKPAVPTRAELRQALAKSRFFMLRDWGDIVILQLPMLLIGHFATAPGEVLTFRLTRILTGLARQLTVQLSRIGGIEMSRQLAQSDRAGLTKLYVEVGRSVGVITGLMCGITVAIAEPLISVWTGGKAPFEPLLLYAFIAGVMIGGPGQNAIMLLGMSNVPRPLGIGMVVQVGLLVTLMVILIPPFGALGAAVALGFADAIYSAWASYAAMRYFRLPEYRYAGVSFGSEVVGFVLSLAIGLGLGQVMVVHGLVSLGTFCLAAGPLLLVAFLLLGLNANQRRKLVQWTRRRARPAPSPA